MIITRPHHPFEGQSLEVLRQARMPAGLQFVLILPDGSKSLIPADWTDFKVASCVPPSAQLIGSLDDLLRLRGLTDALLHRASGLPVTSGASQEAHAATESELHRHSRPGTCLWEQFDDEPKRLVVEALARLLTKASQGQHQEHIDDD